MLTLAAQYNFVTLWRVIRLKDPGFDSCRRKAFYAFNGSFWSQPTVQSTFKMKMRLSCAAWVMKELEYS